MSRRKVNDSHDPLILMLRKRYFKSNKSKIVQTIRHMGKRYFNPCNKTMSKHCIF